MEEHELNFWLHNSWIDAQPSEYKLYIYAQNYAGNNAPSKQTDRRQGC